MYCNMWKLMLVMAFIALKLTNCECYRHNFEKEQTRNLMYEYYCRRVLSTALRFVCSSEYDSIYNQGNNKKTKEIFRY